MKKILLSSLIAVALYSCKDTGKKNADNHQKTVAQPEIHTELYGFWVGDFVDYDSEGFEGGDYDYVKKLNLIIKKITKDTVIAQSIVLGSNRPLIGKMTEDGTRISFVLDAPGKKENDGRFEFELDGDTLKGEWNAYNSKMPNPKKVFKLLKRKFVYNPDLMLPSEWTYVDWSEHAVKQQLDTLDDGKVDTTSNTFFRSASEAIFKLNASKSLLNEAELKNLRKLDLQIIKNTIFARHGYAFTKDTYRAFFEPIEWYVPISRNVDNDLTVIENKNVKLIDRFIKYAEDNYDTFGR